MKCVLRFFFFFFISFSVAVAVLFCSCLRLCMFFTSCFFILGTFLRISLRQQPLHAPLFFRSLILLLIITVIVVGSFVCTISADRTIKSTITGADWASAQMLNGNAFDVDYSRSDVGYDKCLFSSSLYSRYREMTLNRRIFTISIGFYTFHYNVHAST